MVLMAVDGLRLAVGSGIHGFDNNNAKVVADVRVAWEARKTRGVGVIGGVDIRVMMWC